MERIPRLIRLVKNALSDLSAVIPAYIFFPWLGALLIFFLLLFLAKECIKMTRRLQGSRETRHLQRFGGPKAYPVVGNALEMLFTDFYERSIEICKRWGDPVRLWSFGRPILFISSVKYANQIFTASNFDWRVQYLDLRHMKGDSASTAEKKRRLSLSALDQQVGEVPTLEFIEGARNLVKSLGKYVDSEEVFDVVGHIRISIFRMVARKALGEGFTRDGDEDERIQYLDALSILRKNPIARLLSPYPWQRNDFAYFNFTGEGVKARNAKETVVAFTTKAIRKRQEETTRKTTNKIVQGIFKAVPMMRDEIVPDACYLDFLMDLLDSGQLTKDDVVSEMNGFLAAASDPTALTVCWTLLLLALHPHHQNGCVEELSKIISTCPSSDDPIMSATRIERIEYLELCLKESARLFPPVPIVTGSALNDVELSDGHIIPGRVKVLIFTSLVNRDSQKFPDPEKFNPERHLGKGASNFLPFSMGPQKTNSVRETYGMYQAKTVLAYLLLAYEWEASPEMKNLEDVRLAYQGLLFPANGINLRIKRRRKSYEMLPK